MINLESRQKRNKAQHKGSKIGHSKLMKSRDNKVKNEFNVNNDADSDADHIMDADDTSSVITNMTNQSKRKSMTGEALRQRQLINRYKVIQNIKSIAERNLKSTDDQPDTAAKQSAPTADSNEKQVNPRLSNLSSFYRDLNRVIEAADVIVQVLDARDPLGTRCEEIEQAVIAHGPNKRLVLLLNKADLVPTDVLKQWLQYLRNQLPTVAFKSSTQKQNNKLGRINKNLLSATASMLGSSKCMGANVLLKILGNYCKKADTRMAISVGIVGYPNVGKSSVINSLIRSRACTVGSTPGVTKSVQYVHLDSKIRLLDCPGVVFAKPKDGQDSRTQQATLALRNCIKIEQITNPALPVEAILSRVPKSELMDYYKIEDYDTVDQFLWFLAKRYGKLKKGGVPEVYAAAKIVLNDWNSGKIQYYTHPPEKHTLPAYISSEVVAQLSKGFDIDEKFNYDYEDDDQVDMAAAANSELQPTLTTIINVPQATAQVDTSTNSNEVLKSDVHVQLVKRKRRLSSNCEDDKEALQGMQLNLERKREFKRLKKKRQKVNKLSNMMEQALNLM